MAILSIAQMPLMAQEEPDIKIMGTDSLVTFTIKDNELEMVYVEGGTFTMGSVDIKKARPEHQVTLDSYYIGKYEVTQKLWMDVMGDNPSKFVDFSHPVEQVSYDMCEVFLEKLSQITGKHFRFPTEAEWEYAAKGGNKSEGYLYSGSDAASEVAWNVNTTIGYKSTMPIGMKKPNELGIYDMSGNVEEFCSDWFGPYSDSAQVNPQGPSTGKQKVTRGGGWGHMSIFGQTSRRYLKVNGTSYQDFAVGLRVVMDCDTKND